MRTWHNLAALAVLVAIAIVTWVLVLMVLAVPAFSAQAVVTKGYDACLLAEAQRGSYSSTDGGFQRLHRRGPAAMAEPMQRAWRHLFRLPVAKRHASDADGGGGRGFAGVLKIES
jgi:hypothetical protein